MTAMADDSGLEVYDLGGAPGIYSARYAGEGADDGDNLAKLLAEMAGLREDERKARFVCIIALATVEGDITTFSGYVEGRIDRIPRGQNGFGYDPVFVPEGHTLTFAEMKGEEKDAISHRGRALEKVRDYLKTTAGKLRSDRPTC